MRKRISMYWLLPAVAGLALIAVAVLLSSASPGGRVVPSAQAQNINNLCDLQIHKEQVDERDIVVRAATANDASDDDIAYEITVTNLGGDCDGITVQDFLGDNLQCEDAFVVGGDMNYNYFEIEGCKVEKQLSGVTGDDGGEVVTFSTDGLLLNGEEVVLALVARVDQRPGECVENRACVEEGATDSTGASFDDGDSVRACDEVRTCERRHDTPTPTVAPTSTPKPTSTPFVPPPTATAKPLATLVPPKTGTGSESGVPWLAVGLGLGGVCLLLVSGAAVAKRRVR